MRAIVCGGGTGGHIYPALAIASRLRSDGAEILYMGARSSLEEKLAEDNGFTFCGVDACGVHKKSLRLITDLAVNLRGWYQAKRIIRKFAPDVVVGTGGYATAAVVSAAQRLHVSTVLHEQNAFPGLANRVLSRRADAVCLTFSEAGKYFAREKALRTTGLPVRREILLANREAARRYFHISESDEHFTLLITGGSLGAASLNRAAFAAYQPLLEQGIRIIHLCGKNNYFTFSQQIPQHKLLIVKPYLDQMHHALALADLAVARSGASFLAEAAVRSLPTVLIPYPYAANDHQRYNAQSFADVGACRVIEDNRLSGELLADNVLELANDREALKKMSEAAATLAHPNATEKIADVIYGLIE